MVAICPQSNFSQLKAHDEQLERLGLLAERYFADDPNTCLLKLRQLTEGIAQTVASKVGLYTSPDERQIDLLRRLQDHGILPREVGALFHEIRKAGNDAKRDGGGFNRLDKIFNGQLQPVLEAFNDALWVPQPQSAQH